MNAASKNSKTGAKSSESHVAENRRARFNYEIVDTYECGIELMGCEVKSLRQHRVGFGDAYAIVKNGQVYMLGLRIDVFPQATHVTHEPERTRRLLLNRSEIDRIERDLGRGKRTLVPLKMYFKGPWAKVLVGVGEGKTHSDKRDTIKDREAQRDIERAMQRSRR